MTRAVMPLQFSRHPTRVVKPWAPVPVVVAPKADLIPAGLRGPTVKRRFTDKALFPRSPQAERQVFRSTTRIHMKDASTLRTFDPSPRIFVRARLTHLLKEGAVFAFGGLGFLAFILAILLATGPR